MMRSVKSLLMRLFSLLLACSFLVEVCQSQGLSVIGPKYIRPGSRYTIALSNSLAHDANLQIQLENGTQIIIAHKTKVPRRTARSVVFNVEDISKDEYFLTIDSLDSKFSFSQRVDLEYEAKTMSVFIQTDKPVYTPGDRIRFRVVVVDVDTRPVKSIKTVSVALTNEEEESIRQWPYARLHNGVFESTVQLASAPKLGNWTLTVKTKEGDTLKYIEVKEYVLPKFSVKAAPSKILLAKDMEVAVAIKCHYTFGEPVVGFVTVDLYVDEYSTVPVFSSTAQITGATNVDFKLKDEVEMEGDANVAYVTAKVKVIETFSNRTVNITQLIPVYRNPFVVTLLPSRPSFRPGVEFPVTISVKDHFNRPPREPSTVNMTVRTEGTNVEEEKALEGTLDDQGTASFTLKPPVGAERLSFSVLYDSVEYDTEPKEITGYHSESNQYIKIFLHPKYKAKVNKEVTFDVSCTAPMSHLSYIVVARGTIIAASNIVISNKKKYSFKYKLLPQMSPEARIIVFYMNKNFLIYDDLELHFDEFNNNFKFQLDQEQYHPGQDFYVTVHAAKDSYVAFQAIDQSVLLVGEDTHSFTRKDVLKDLSLYSSKSPNDYDPWQTMGLFLRSTAVVDIPSSRDQMNRFGGYGKRVVQVTHIRTVFPESWFWVNRTMDGRKTQLDIVDTVPDTITSWYIAGFALSPTLGLGVIRQPVKFEVRQPFFLVANLPYSIKRGEVALIQVTVFNFLGNTVTSDVTLFNKNEEVEFVEQSSSDPTRRTKAVVVPENNGKPISFMIKAKKLGQIAIKFEAINQLKSDAIEHMLRVTPESRLYEGNEARFIDLDSHGTKSFDLSINIPRGIDEGSSQIKFSLDPDLLGKTIDNLENLIRLPTGCGEQNMMNFVPNIVILDYISETRNVPEQFETKAVNHLKSGYENQLKYKRSDGSFSVWGPKDSQGSTFLTAFVAKSLKIAAKYIEVDKQVVEEAFKWLASKQLSDGRFPEVGNVWHKDMQGGLHSTSYALTSYVLIAFTENEDIARQYRQVVSRTMSYLATNFESITDVYDLALASYGMALGNHADRNKFFDKLMEASVFDKNATTRYWNRSPVDVEVAGYALLTNIANDHYTTATPIMRWLNQQRYALGGFPGTQDTFVGLKALAKYAARLSAHRNDYRVRIKHDPNKLYTFDVDKTKSMVIQEQDIPDHIRKVKVEIEGIGHGFFQVAYQYYYNIEKAKRSFNLHVDVLNTTSYDVQRLKVCVAYIPKEAYDRSSMTLVEVFFPSGMIAEPDAVRDLSPMQEIKNTELRFAATSVVVYYDNLGKVPVCFEVTALRKHKVALQLPAYVVVYDYYNRDLFAIQKYEGKVLQLCDICDDEDCETLSC